MSRKGRKDHKAYALFAFFAIFAAKNQSQRKSVIAFKRDTLFLLPISKPPLLPVAKAKRSFKNFTHRIPIFIIIAP